jgi:thiol-disulfide isomerase/thioredoxin
MNLLKLFNRNCKGMNPILCCVATAVILFCLFSCLLPFVRRLIKRTFSEGFTGASEFVFYHMNGCPHCTNMMPEWSKFESNNDSGIKTRKTEQGEAPDEVKKYGITGYPSLVLLDSNGDKIKDYKGPRTANAFAAFCSENS